MQRLVPELVQRAVEILGGIPQLAIHLGAQEHTIHFWLSGKAAAPNEVLVQLVDLVLQDDVARAQSDRRKHPRPDAEEMLADPG